MQVHDDSDKHSDHQLALAWVFIIVIAHMRLVVIFSLLANISYKNVLRYAFGIVPHEDNYNSAVHCLYSDRLHRAR